MKIVKVVESYKIFSKHFLLVGKKKLLSVFYYEVKQGWSKLYLPGFTVVFIKFCRHWMDYI